MAALNAAVDQGLNFIDTALAYGNGHSEKLVGRLVRERSEHIYVASKIPPKNKIWPARGTLDEVFPADYIVQCTELTLKNLGFEQLDLMQLHVWNPEWMVRDEWHQALEQLRKEGKIAHFGISINDHDPGSALEIVRSGLIDSVQVIYNIFDQSPEDELFAACQEHQVGVLARVPFDEGSLTGKITPQTTFPKGDWRNVYFKGDRKKQVWDRVQKMSNLLGGEVESLPELALRFCLHHSAVSSVIPGMRKAAHVQANTAVSDLPPLSEGMLAELRKFRWVRNFYPEV